MLTVRFRWFGAKSLSVRRGDWDCYVYRVRGIDNVSMSTSIPKFRGHPGEFEPDYSASRTGV